MLTVRNKKKNKKKNKVSPVICPRPRKNNIYIHNGSTIHLYMYIQYAQYPR